MQTGLQALAWLSITLDPDFIQTHLNNFHKIPSVLTASSDMEGTSYYKTFSIISNSFDDSVNLPLPSCLSTDYFSSSCNGLLCFSDYRGTDFYLWNPSTRQGKKIPSRVIKGYLVNLIFVGFYFDSVSNDNKILRLAFVRDDLSRLIVLVELYSTKSDSGSEIQVDEGGTSSELGRFSYRIIHAPVIKGVLYISGRFGELISYQLNHNMLKPVSLPSNCKVNEVLHTMWGPKVFDFEGCAALILHGNNVDSLSLWTLDDDDDDDDDGRASWTKKLNLEADIMKNWTIIYFGVGQLFAWEDYNKVIRYDYKKKETKEHRLQLPSSNWYIDSFFRHTESLVSLKGFGEL